MAQIVTINLIIPKWRILSVRAAIYVLAAGYHMGLISASRIDATVEPLTNWLAKGLRVR